MTTAADDITTANSDTTGSYRFLVDDTQSNQLGIIPIRLSRQRTKKKIAHHLRKRKSPAGVELEAAAKAVGWISIKLSDCVPYLKCFNVEDIVNIRGHFSLLKNISLTQKLQHTDNEGNGKQKSMQSWWIKQDWVTLMLLQWV